MRPLLLTCGIALVGLSVAHPAADRRDSKFSRRDTTIYDADQTEPTQVPKVVIYVDQDNHELERKTETLYILPIAMKPKDEQFTPAVQPAPELDTSDNGSQKQTHHEGVTAEAKQEPQSQQVQAGGGFGTTYTVYQPNGQPCKDAGAVLSDLSRIAAAGFSKVRIYGVDCNQVANVHAAARATGLGLWLGLFDMGTIEQDVRTMADQLGGDWGLVEAVSVGNELVNSGQMSAGDVLGKVGYARALLQQRGFNGPVVTVDTFIAVQNNPQLCQDAPICAINAHAFFDPTVEAPGAGDWLDMEVQKTSQAIGGGKRIVVTESGWPSADGANGKAVATYDNQQTAIGSIRNKFGNRAGDVFLFSFFNEPWKGNGIESHFGFAG